MYDVIDLISALRLPKIPAVEPSNLKHLLILIARHTSTRAGWAWASQLTLSAEMAVSLSTIERTFKSLRHLGLIEVKRVRTGKNPKDQHNEYRLIQSGFKTFTPEHPSSVTADADTNTRHREPEHPSQSTRTPVTHDGIGLELKAGIEERQRDAQSASLTHTSRHVAENRDTFSHSETHEVEIPEILKSKSPEELRETQKLLLRSIKDHRLPEPYRKQCTQCLAVIAHVLAGNTGNVAVEVIPSPQEISSILPSLSHRETKGLQTIQSRTERKRRR